MLAISTESMVSDGLLQYDVREWAAGMTNIVRDLRNRRGERIAKATAAAAKSRAGTGRGGR